jgi:hypothetical protein
LFLTGEIFLLSPGPIGTASWERGKELFPTGWLVLEELSIGVSEEEGVVDSW